MSQRTLFPDRSPATIDEALYRLFERVADEVRAAGFTRFSADAILHRIRWHRLIERGDRTFRVNNNESSKLARALIARRPEFRDFFELRVLKSGGES